MDERARRRALNEATFRRINERLIALNETFADLTGRFAVVCECDDAACIEQLTLRPEEYESVRADPTLYILIPGHESPAVESVVEKREGHNVVRKRPGEPAEIAAATDPRSD